MQLLLLALVLGLLHFAIGGLWYSPLAFAGPWMRGLGLTQADIREAKVNIPASLAASAIASMAQAATLVLLISALPTSSIATGAIVGAGVALAFSFLPMLKDRLWADRPWSVVLIDGGYEVLAAAVVGTLAAWWLG